MKKHYSYFKNTSNPDSFFRNWQSELEAQTGTIYHELILQTSLGKTVVHVINPELTNTETLVVFPGFRTFGLIWDVDNNLAELKKKYRIFLVDINGQPCMSEGNSPSIKNNDYGIWAKEVITQLSKKKVTIAGASFGGLVCIKTSLVCPELINKIILLNPGCMQMFSLKLKNMYYNFLPIIATTRNNVAKFLKTIVFYSDHHSVEHKAFNMLNEYEYFAIKNYVDKTEKPYEIPDHEMKQVSNDVYLLVGEKDLLFPYKHSVSKAKRCLSKLKEVHILPDTGHGIEISKPAMNIVARIMEHNK